MKTERLKMAAKLIVCVAILVVGFSFGTASAASDAASNALLYTYYDVRSIGDGGLGLTDNYFTVTNTDTNWVQAHVRVRTGDKSVELLDFDVLLSPKDVFAFDLYQAANGGIEFASCDTHTLINSGFTVDALGCVVLNSATNPNLLSLIMKCQAVDQATALLATQKGYVEVIGEGKIVPDPLDKNKCFSWISGAFQNIPGRTLYNIESAPNSCVPSDIASMDNVLEGKVYYVTVAGDLSVQRLAYLNAEALDDVLPAWNFGVHAGQNIILHADTYAAEQIRCGGDPGCFAYVDASTALVTNGAQDLNICFYKRTITVANDVTNRFGAAASFGPQLADINLRRDGSIPTTATILNTLSLNYSQFDGNLDMWNGFGTGIAKTVADTHFFYVPAPAFTLDMAVKVAFIFPFQHYIGEADSIALAELWDTEENTTTTPSSKFISPGLPTPATPGQEAQIFTFSPPFAEGWVSFAPLASNATCAVLDADDVRCSGSTTAVYLPGYTSAVFTSGDGALGASHMHYRGAEIE